MSNFKSQISPQTAAEFATRQNLVVANGCFDCFHAGHAALLKFARSQGEALLVLLNSDESIKRLKGETRPIWNFRERYEVLMACRYVDEVLEFDEDTPERLLRQLHPSVLVKGAEFTDREIAGQQFCGRVALAPMVTGISTTEIVDRIRFHKSPLSSGGNELPKGMHQ